MSHLLDANALIALAWPTHVHHSAMQRWFRQHARSGWSTCALTQAAFVRICSQQAFSDRIVSVAAAAEVLLRNTAHEHHRLIKLDFEFSEVVGHCTGGVHGHRQITDAWLLTAAIRNRAKLVTFDSGLSQLLATAREREQHVSLLSNGKA